MKKLFQIIFILVTMIFFVVSAAYASNTNQLLFAAGCPTTSSYYPFEAFSAKLASDYTDNVEFTVLSLSGSVAVIKALYDGEIDVGAGAVTPIYESINGIGVWEGKKQDNIIRVLNLTTYCDDPFAVTISSGIKSIKDLQGKKIWLGNPGSDTSGQGKLALDALGIEVQEFIGNISDAVAAMKDRRIDGILKGTSGHSLDSSHIEIMTTIPLRLVSFTKEEVDTVLKKYPWLDFVTRPAGFYTAFPDLGEIHIISPKLLMLCRNDLPDEIAYGWVKAVTENWGKLSELFSGCEFVEPLLTPKVISSVPNIYIAKGAIEYYKERNAEIPISVVPPEF